MVDYTKELRRLRDMHDDFLLRYANSRSTTPSEQEVTDARAIRKEIRNVWILAIQTDCKDSELELVALEDLLEKLSRRRKYTL